MLKTLKKNVKASKKNVLKKLSKSLQLKKK